MSRFRILFLISISILAALALAACGDEGGDEDPQEVLQATFSNESKVTSGVFDVSIDVSAEGGEQAGTFEASLGGPFQSAEDAFPSFDIEAEAELDSEQQDFSGSAGVISTGDRAFVNFQDTDYEVPQELVSQFTATFNQLQQQQSEEQGADGNFLAALGVDPTNWMTDLSNEGDEDVEGTETVHISGDADVPKLVADLRTIVEKAPAAAGQRVTPEQLAQLDELTEIIESAEIDVYSGKDDDILRKLEASLDLNPPDTEGSPDSVELGFTITLSEVNESQEISAPESAQPLSELLGQFGIDPGQLGSGLDAATGGGGGTPQAGGEPQGPSGNASQAYLDCLATAEGAAAVQECSELLQP